MSQQVPVVNFTPAHDEAFSFANPFGGGIQSGTTHIPDAWAVVPNSHTQVYTTDEVYTKSETDQQINALANTVNNTKSDIINAVNLSLDAKFNSLAANNLKAAISGMLQTDDHFRDAIVESLLTNTEFVNALTAKVQQNLHQ